MNLPSENKEPELAVEAPAHTPATGDFFPQLDGVRGLAILSVVFYHIAYFNLSHPIQKVLFCFAKAGFMGVQMFFVLSGFLISYTIFKSGDRFNATSYTWRRAAKIYPPFVLSLIIFSLVSYFWWHTPNLLPSIFAYITTLAHFTLGWATLNFAFWTLMIEVHFYITLPIIYFCLRRWTRYADWITLLLFLIVPSLIRWFSYLPNPTDRSIWAFHANIFPRSLDNFALGILFAILYKNRTSFPFLSRVASFALPLGVLILASAYSLYAYLQYLYNIEIQPSIACFEIFRFLPALGTFCLLFSICLPAHRISRALSWKPLVFTGVISYEWFLFHLPPSGYINIALGDAQGSWLVYLAKTLLPFVGTYGLAVLIYFYFSAPILAWVKEHLAKSKTAVRIKG